MRISEFVTKVANPYFPIDEDFSNLSDEFLVSSLQFAVKNKVFPLFYDGCLRLGIRLPKEAEVLAHSYEKKRRMQLEAVNLLLDLSDKLGIELMFFKTFKPFKYIPDDVDVLLRNENDLKPLIAKLKENGYFILKVGTPEIVLRKVGEGSYVDIDIHTRLAVGHFDLFQVESLWRKRAYEKFKLDNGRVALKLSEDYEVVREAAYSLLKDFNLSISGLYLGINALMHRRLADLEKVASEENFLQHLHLYLYTTYYVACRLFGSKARSQLQYRFKEDGLPITFLLRLLNAQLRKSLRLPYPFPIPVIAWAYTVKVKAELSRNKNLKALLQLMKQPSSKGVGILLDYIRESFR